MTLTPWNELRVALAELAEARSYVKHFARTGDTVGLQLAEAAYDRAIASLDRAADSLAPPDINSIS